MQRLVYVPPWSQFGDSDNVVLALAAPFVLGTVSGTDGADTAFITSSVPGMAGELVQSVKLESRIIPCLVNIDGDTRGDMYEKRKRLARLLFPAEKAGTLYYSNDCVNVCIDAYPQSSPSATRRIHNYNQVDIKFFCPTPFWRDISDTEVKVAYVSGYSFPMKIGPMHFGIASDSEVVINTEPIPIPLEITIKAPATNPIVIRNDTTGEEIKLLHSLDKEEFLTISTKRGNIFATLTHADGSAEDAFHYLEPESVFFSLQPGENVLRYTTWNESEATFVSVKYRVLYAGV